MENSTPSVLVTVHSEEHDEESPPFIFLVTVDPEEHDEESPLPSSSR